MMLLDLIPGASSKFGITGYENSPLLIAICCFAAAAFDTFDVFLYLYHQYSNANVKQAKPMPTNITMNTPPETRQLSFWRCLSLLSTFNNNVEKMFGGPFSKTTRFPYILRKITKVLGNTYVLYEH